jgi:hypothetical protein
MALANALQNMDARKRIVISGMTNAIDVIKDNEIL